MFGVRRGLPPSPAPLKVYGPCSTWWSVATTLVKACKACAGTRLVHGPECGSGFRVSLVPCLGYLYGF